jgi:hypothetical protein
MFPNCRFVSCSVCTRPCLSVLQLRSFDVNGSTVGVFTCKDMYARRRLLSIAQTSDPPTSSVSLYHDPKASLLAAGVRVFSYASHP